MRRDARWYHVVAVLLLIGIGLLAKFYDPPIELGDGAIDDEEAERIMYGLLNNRDEQDELLERILGQKDERFVIILMDVYAMRGGNGYGAGRRSSGPIDVLDALMELSGQDFGHECSKWMAWYLDSGLMPPRGYSAWKGALLGSHNKKLAGYFHPDMAATIRVEEIIWGGVSEDGLPPLDDPPMVAAKEAAHMTELDAIIGVEYGGEARAYPLRMIDWHEMVNDTVGEKPFSLAYCTLCNAAIAFGRTASDGEIYHFASSGCLYRSNKLMVDAKTSSMWNQLTGIPVTGPLVGTDTKLEKMPTVTTTWGVWKQRHPDSLVLAEDTGYDNDYRPGYAYGSYFASADTKVYANVRDSDVPPKTIVYAVEHQGAQGAWIVNDVIEKRSIIETLGGDRMILLAEAEEVQIKGLYRGQVDVDYSPGAAIRAYAIEEVQLKYDSLSDEIRDTNGGVWTQSEGALTGPGGRTLNRVPGHLAYWFAWHDFYPDTRIFTYDSSSPLKQKMTVK